MKSAAFGITLIGAFAEDIAGGIKNFLEGASSGQSVNDAVFGPTPIIDTPEYYIEEEVQPGKDHPYNPGVPTAEDGFVPPKNWDSEKVRTRGGQYGYPDKKGNVWVPTNPGNAHGGSHWDVQHKDGSHTNVYPK